VMISLDLWMQAMIGGGAVGRLPRSGDGLM
jgi:hypothetical protein